MYGYNPADPPRCIDENCGGNTWETKRDGDDWVWMRCYKCGLEFVILGHRIRTGKGVTSWDKDHQEISEESSSKLEDLRRDLKE